MHYLLISNENSLGWQDNLIDSNLSCYQDLHNEQGFSSNSGPTSHPIVLLLSSRFTSQLVIYTFKAKTGKLPPLRDGSAVCPVQIIFWFHSLSGTLFSRLSSYHRLEAKMKPTGFVRISSLRSRGLQYRSQSVRLRL